MPLKWTWMRCATARMSSPAMKTSVPSHSDAIEVDVDALCDGTDVFIAGVMEHIEEAGIHSGDSACVLPPHTLGGEMLDRIREQAAGIALALGVVGLLNVQFAIHGDDGLHVI